MTSKHDREYQRRRYEKYQRAQAAKAKKKRQQRMVALTIVGALVLAITVTGIIALNQNQPQAEAQPTPTATPTPPELDYTAAPHTFECGPSTGATPSPNTDPQVPSPDLAEDRAWTGTLQLSQGELGIELCGTDAPQAVANFVALAQDGYFDGTTCHRLTTSGIYVLQCGDPTATGTGGPGYTWGPIENAPADGLYPAGTIAMARAGTPDSMGSQFFIVYGDTTLPTEGGGYTVFGHVTSGLDVVQGIAEAGEQNGTGDGAPTSPVTIEGVEVS